MSHQYYSYTLHFNTHLMRFIYWYCTLIYVICTIHYILFLIIAELCFSLRFRINYVLVFSNTNFAVDKLIHNLPFFSPPHSKHLKTEPCQFSVDHSEGDCGSDINRLAWHNLRQYTSVTNQCKQFLWILMWHISYCDCWSHFENGLGRL